MVTTKSPSVTESTFKGTYEIDDEKNDPFPKIDQLQDFPKIEKSKSVEGEGFGSGSYSKYEIKLRKPRTSIDLILPSPIEEHS